MKRYNLLVKGDIRDALRELCKRVPIARLLLQDGVGVLRSNAVRLTVEIEERSEIIIYNWLGETPKIIEDYGFPNGTLLHFSEDTNV